MPAPKDTVLLYGLLKKGEDESNGSMTFMEQALG
jgi:hypothetical protein